MTNLPSATATTATSSISSQAPVAPGGSQHADRVRALAADVRRGLTSRPRTLPSKWLYDQRGSELFEQITELPEYYPARAETEILTCRAPQIAAASRCQTLMELGSGSSGKTRLLLDALTAAGSLHRYIPVDVSASALEQAVDALAAAYPDITVDGTVADFEDGVPPTTGAGRRLIAFLGSTLGNFEPQHRSAFLSRLARSMQPGDRLLLGVDLVKAPEVLVPAYDDAAGVTAAFDRNVLHVINRELGADFDPAAFAHRAVWDAVRERIEMRLQARAAKTITVPGASLILELAAGEEIRTEISTKFRREPFTAELDRCGLTVRDWWTDHAGRYALLTAVTR